MERPNDERDPADLLPMIPVVIIVIVIIVLIWPKKRCWKCGKRMTGFNRLDSSQQNHILRYYNEVENTTPDISQVHACLKCGYVVDEDSYQDSSPCALPVACRVCGAGLLDLFAGPIDPTDLAAFFRMHRRLFTGERCPQCGDVSMTPFGCPCCDVAEPLRGCRACHTLHAWVPFPPGEFLFFTPLKDDEAIDRFLSKSSQDAPV